MLVHIAETPVFDVVRTPLDGSAVDTLLRSVADKVPTSVGPDGRSWAFVAGGHVFVRDGNDAPVRSPSTGTSASTRSSHRMADGSPTPLYTNNTVGYGVSPEGQRFFLVIPQDNARPSTVVLVLDWRRDLEQAVPR